MSTTQDIITSAETLLAGITPGEWYDTVTGEGVPCVNVSNPEDYHGFPVCIRGMILNDANIAFIAASPELVRELVEEVKRLREEAAWRPIETCPEGREVMACVGIGGPCFIIEYHKMSPQVLTDFDGEECWYTAFDHPEYLTHWRLLPDMEKP